METRKTMKKTEQDSLLHIFTGEGNTFTFHNVVLLTDNESILSFQYGAMSDGRVKIGEFSKKRIVGFSMTK
jgi:hypothetical protein